MASFYNRIGKRLFDIGFAIFGVLLCFPILVIIAVLVRAKLGRQVLFTQSRPGIQGIPFVIYKFRTMTDVMDNKGNLLPDDKRLTSFGRFLRSTSLDELPELFNVLKGNMSLVGPRPLMMEYLPLYNQEQMRRHSVRPGITGWAQVNGRNALSWEEKFNFDLWYIDNRNFGLDIKILLLTFVGVIRRDGITAHGSVTMPEFMGSKIGGDEMEFFSDKRPSNLTASNSVEDEKLLRKKM